MTNSKKKGGFVASAIGFVYLLPFHPPFFASLTGCRYPSTDSFANEPYESLCFALSPSDRRLFANSLEGFGTFLH